MNARVDKNTLTEFVWQELTQFGSAHPLRETKMQGVYCGRNG